MKKTGIVLSILFLSAAVFAEAPKKAGPWGLGIVLGQPSGITVKWRMDKVQAVDACAAWSFDANGGSIHLHADYLWHFYDVFSVPEGKLPLYAGVGAIFNASSSPSLGGRVPLGMAYEFEKIPLEIFLEVAPVLTLIPGTGFNGNGGLGARYYF